MKLVYGISRWTNPNRSAARHIDDGKGQPLCGGLGRKAFTWEKETGQPTCQRCKGLDALYEEANKIYHNYLWNGHNTDAEVKRLSELRRQYILKSGGKQMPELQYKSFN